MSEGEVTALLTKLRELVIEISRIEREAVERIQEANN
jgi:hypothetical protein